MKCPVCSSTNNKVYDSRYSHDKSQRLRYRICSCGHRFVTSEIMREELNYMQSRIKELDGGVDKMTKIKELYSHISEFTSLWES